MGLFWVWPLLIVVGLGLLAYLGYQRAQGGTRGDEQSGNGAGGEARRILDERFARGEIDEEEYRRRRTMLG
ncbi:SHOCT domain-containing protein [Pseudonocardia yuanmonensis]